MRRIVPALAAALACTACTMPVFDPSMSLAGRTLDRIPVAGVTNRLKPPVDGSNRSRFDLRRDRLAFMPERTPAGGFDVSKGFVIQGHEDMNTLWYEWPGGTTTEWIEPIGSYPGGERMPSQWLLWLKKGPYLRVMFVNGTEAYADRLWANTAVPEMTFNPFAYHTYNRAVNIAADLALGPTPNVMGMSVQADVPPMKDKIAALVRNGSNYSEAWNFVSEEAFPAWNAIWPPNYTLSFLGTPWRLNYHRDFWYNRSFAQTYDPAKDAWTTWVWWTPVPDYANLTGITRRIDAVLSTDAGAGASHLFSTEGGIGRVYRYDGTGAGALVAQFGLGTLHFLGEANVMGVWKMVFSRCVADVPNSDSAPGQFHFEIRAINTARLVSTFAP